LNSDLITWICFALPGILSITFQDKHAVTTRGNPDEKHPWRPILHLADFNAGQFVSGPGKANPSDFRFAVGLEKDPDSHRKVYPGISFHLQLLQP
jgi:hypothetical protein